jgi:hypothetical protein
MAGTLYPSLSDAQKEDIAGVGNVFHAADGKSYKWVKFVDQDVVLADVLYPASTDGTEVTTDYSGGSGLSAKVVGVAITAVDISDKAYGWIQIAGVVSTSGDGGVSAGDAVVGHATDGEADTMADGEEELVFGFALAADTGSPAVFNCYLSL